MPALPSNLETTQRSVPGSYSLSGQLQQASEYVPQLRWPESVYVFNRMRRDAKCAGVLRAATMPVRATGWHVVDSPDVRPEVAQFVRNNLGLNEVGTSRRRRRGQGISWDDFLRHALLMLPFGHMYFEPVFTVAPPGPGDVGLKAGKYAHLSRMAPILPSTITGFNVAANGDLVSITQQATLATGHTVDVPLPAELIIPFVNDQEGADWAGTSLLREAYKHWFLKDQLERVAAQIVERNGMGIPVAKYGVDGDRELMLNMATSVRAGEQSGIAIRSEDDFMLMGVTGSTVDPMPQIAYHGEEIAGSVLAMFLTLGHDAGARNLGETFVDYFTMAVSAVIAGLEETCTEEMSRRLVEINFGPDEAYPEISADPIDQREGLTAEAVAAMAMAGALTPGPSLDAWVREHFGMTPASPPPPGSLPGAVPSAAAPSPTPAATPADPAATVPAAPAVGTPAASTGPPAATAHSVPAETLPQAETRLARMREAVFHRRGR